MEFIYFHMSLLSSGWTKSLSLFCLVLSIESWGLMESMHSTTDLYWQAFSVRVCVCACACVHACMCACAFMHMNVEIRQHLSFLGGYPPWCWASQWVPDICPFVCPQSSDDKGHRAQHFRMGLGDLNSGPFACKGSILFTELSPLPPYKLATVSELPWTVPVPFLEINNTVSLTVAFHELAEGDAFTYEQGKLTVN